MYMHLIATPATHHLRLGTYILSLTTFPGPSC